MMDKELNKEIESTMAKEVEKKVAAILNGIEEIKAVMGRINSETKQKLEDIMTVLGELKKPMPPPPKR